MLPLLSNQLQKSLSRISKRTTVTLDEIKSTIRDIKLALLTADVNLLVVKKLVKAITDQTVGKDLPVGLEAPQHFVQVLRKELQKTLGGKTKRLSLSKKPEVVMLVGLQGSGKTTTAAKLTKYFVENKSVQNPLLVTTDVYRPAAFNQLSTLAKSTRTSFFETPLTTPPVTIGTTGLAHAENNRNDFVVVDTAGRLAIDHVLMDELVQIKKVLKPQEVIFVTDAFAGQEIVNVAQAFHDKLGLTGCIITKMDSDARGGAALSITSLLHVPVLFVGTSEKLGGLELFHPDRMVSRILGGGDILSLIEKADAVVDKPKTRRTILRMKAGRFDLNDLLEQLVQFRKMGKLSKIMKLIPGAQKIPAEKIDDASKKLDLFRVLISSMTASERANPRLLKHPRRKARIISGSGRTAREYNLLVTDFERMQKQMKLLLQQVKGGNLNILGL